MIYLIIFVLKICENAISTIRYILISNGKKTLGSILLFIISIIWILSNSITIINLNFIGILVFSLGSLTGSYFGSLIEEKIALGNILVLCICNKNISSKLRNIGYIVTDLSANGISGSKNIMLIIIKRRKRNQLFEEIFNLDKDTIILNEYVSIEKNRF